MSNTTTTNAPRDLIILTPYPVDQGHTLLTVARLSSDDWKPEMKSSASYIAEGDNAGIIINKPASIMDYNKTQAAQKERQQPPNAKMSFKVYLINSESGKLSLEHRTLRFWLNNNHNLLLSTNNNNNNDNNSKLITNEDDFKSTRTFSNIKQESSQLAQAYFCKLVGSKQDDFPKNYVAFIMKLMRLLKTNQFTRIIKMEVELRQIPIQEDHTKPPSRASSIDGSQSGESGGRGSPLTSQKVLDIIESSYPKPISIKEICSTSQTEESIVKQFLEELTTKAKINSTDNGQHFTRTIDTKINLVKQMPKVTKSQQPVIAIITAQYCEKLAVDSMISDKETYVRYRTTGNNQTSFSSSTTDNQSQQNNNNADQLSSANYVYTLGNIGDHRVVSTKLTSIGHSMGASIAAGSTTTRLLGTFPEIEYVFLVGCGGGVVNYTDFSSHVRLGDVVISNLPDSGDPTTTIDQQQEQQSNDNGDRLNSSSHQYVGSGKSPTSSDYIYVHCRPKHQSKQDQAPENKNNNSSSGSASGCNIPVSYSIHKNLRKAGSNSNSNGGATASASGTPESIEQQQQTTIDTDLAKPDNKPLEYNDCHFRLWRPTRLDLQALSQRLWCQGLDNSKHRIWEYYIDEGIKNLKQQDIDATKPTEDTDKLFMSIGQKETIEVNHPEAGEGEVDLRRQGRPMCHFGVIGSGRPALIDDTLKQRMISEFNLRAFDSEFDPVVESIYGNCKESYIIIRGISDYKDGRKKKEWQQYSALVAAAFMKSIIVNL